VKASKNRITFALSTPEEVLCFVFGEYMLFGIELGHSSAFFAKLSKRCGKDAEFVLGELEKQGWLEVASTGVCFSQKALARLSARGFVNALLSPPKAASLVLTLSRDLKRSLGAIPLDCRRGSSARLIPFVRQMAQKHPDCNLSAALGAYRAGVSKVAPFSFEGFAKFVAKRGNEFKKLQP
jgi:hypothetical protein